MDKIIKLLENFEKECFEISKKRIKQIEEDIKKIKTKYLKKIRKNKEDYMDIYVGGLK